MKKKRFFSHEEIYDIFKCDLPQDRVPVTEYSSLKDLLEHYHDGTDNPKGSMKNEKPHPRNAEMGTGWKL